MDKIIREELVSEFKALVSELKLDYLLENMSDEDITEGLENMPDKINQVVEEKTKSKWLTLLTNINMNHLIMMFTLVEVHR